MTGEFSTARPPATRGLFLLMTNQNQTSPPLIPRTNLLTLALYMSHSGSSFGDRCVAVTAVHAECVFVWGVLQFSVERSGTIDLSRHPKIFVRAAISESWGKDFAKRAHFRPSENLGRFIRQHFYPRAVIMGTKSCTKILNFSTRFSCENLAVEDFVTWGKNLVDGEMFCLGMVSTKL